jgi:hypothetical protein
MTMDDVSNANWVTFRGMDPSELSPTFTPDLLYSAAPVTPAKKGDFAMCVGRCDPTLKSFPVAAWETYPEGVFPVIADHGGFPVLGFREGELVYVDADNDGIQVVALDRILTITAKGE